MAPIRERRASPSAFAAICLLGAFLFSTARIASSLWQDETATFWVVKDGLHDVASRSWVWSGQSALYYLTAWLGRHLAPAVGLETALRLPSLLAMVATLYLVYRLGRRFGGRSVGVVSALALLCLPDVAFAAIDARPYALGLALLAAATLCLVEWSDTGRLFYALLYVVTAALVVYAHYLFALALVPHLFYDARRRRALAALWVGVAALCAPLAGQVLYFYRTRQNHSFAPSPGVDSFFSQIAPPVLAGTVLLAIVLRRKTADEPPPLPWSFLFAWLLVPTSFLFLLSLTTEVKLFVPRYVLGCAPPAAILAAWVIVRCSAVRAASAVLLLSLGLRVWTLGSEHGLEDWRGAMQALRAEATPADRILVTSGFVEATPERLHDPILHDVLYAPQTAYGVRAFHPLPFAFDESAVPADLARAPRVFLVTRRTTFAGHVVGMQYEDAVHRLVPAWHIRKLGPFFGISVVAFEP